MVSSTASLFESSDCEHLEVDAAPLNLEKYLFSDTDNFGGSATSDLFTDFDPSELNIIGDPDPNLVHNMDMIDGATLFKVLP